MSAPKRGTTMIAQLASGDTRVIVLDRSPDGWWCRPIGATKAVEVPTRHLREATGKDAK